MPATFFLEIKYSVIPAPATVAPPTAHTPPPTADIISDTPNVNGAATNPPTNSPSPTRETLFPVACQQN